MVFLCILNFIVSPDYWWFLFPLVGWGVFVIVHYFIAFVSLFEKFKNWEEKELSKEVKYLQESQENLIDEEDILLLQDDPPPIQEKVKLRKNWNEQVFV